MAIADHLSALILFSLTKQIPPNSGARPRRKSADADERQSSKHIYRRGDAFCIGGGDLLNSQHLTCRY